MHQELPAHEWKAWKHAFTADNYCGTVHNTYWKLELNTNCVETVFAFYFIFILLLSLHLQVCKEINVSLEKLLIWKKIRSD